MVGHKPASRRCFGIAFVSKRPPVMMDWAAFSVSGSLLSWNSYGPHPDVEE